MTGFLPMLDGFDQVPFGNLNEVRAAITDETAAILVEPVQGEGGINYASEDYLNRLRETADEQAFSYFWTRYKPEWAGQVNCLLISGLK